MPDYPRQARLRGVEGLVLLEAILDLEGGIEDNIKVLQSIPSLDQAAVDALTSVAVPASPRPHKPTGTSHSRSTRPLCIEIRRSGRHLQGEQNSCSFL